MFSALFISSTIYKTTYWKISIFKCYVYFIDKIQAVTKKKWDYTKHREHTSTGYADVEMIYIECGTSSWDSRRATAWDVTLTMEAVTHTPSLEHSNLSKNTAGRKNWQCKSPASLYSTRTPHSSTHSPAWAWLWPWWPVTLCVCVCVCVCACALCICTSTVPSVVEGQGTTPEEQKNVAFINNF